MKKTILLAAPLLLAVLSVPYAVATGNEAFGFNGTVSGFPTGVVKITGGGAYNPSTAFVHSAGGFRCIEAVGQGPLNGCAARDGIRWDTEQLLDSSPFKCFAAETAHTAVTGDKTVVLNADFYKAGDGRDATFKDVKMIVSEDDIDPDLPGIQNLWIQGVGCGEAITHFN